MGFMIDEDIKNTNIVENKIIHRAIGFYTINPKNGLLHVKPVAEKLITRDKQYGVLLGDWFLVKYPISKHKKLALTRATTFKIVKTPSYFVLVNLKTKQWTIGLDTTFAKHAPTNILLKKLYGFYGNDILRD